MTTDQMKKQARQHEQNEEWGKALLLYQKVLDAGEEGGEPEIALYNRVADLQVRIGDVEGAIENYDRAIDLYLDADLPNNAMAICRKVLRNVPGRAETFLRMGQIRAAQGFGVDARQHVLTYAELMQSRGDAEAATAALEELVALFPDDAEGRVFLGERLVALGDLEAGVAQLVGAWQVLHRQGSDEVDALGARIRDLDPEVALDAEAAPPAPTDDGEGDPGFTDLLEGGAGPMEDLLDADDAGDPGDLDTDFPGLELPDLEPTGLAGPPEDPEVPAHAGAEEDDLPEPDTASEHASDEEEFSFGEIELDAEIRIEEEPDEPDERGEPDDASTEVEGDDFPPLPLLGADEGKADEGAELPDLAPLAGDSLLDFPDDPDAPAALEAALRAEPGRLDLHRMLVDRAQADADRPLLLRALRGLAAALDTAGIEKEAEAVYRQVLQLDPRDRDALRALEGEAEAPAPAAGAPTARGGGFVDLGALVLDDAGSPTTRWVVEDDRSGDEAVDFAGMLSKFKAKVAENINRDDARSSYDLGTAYREMGLVDEAIGMFQQALRAHPGHLASLEVLGQCFLDRGEPQVAIRVLERALGQGAAVEDDLLGIYYFLGVAHERAGNGDEAREFYEKVFSLDINFKDVTDRLRELR
jgi:tetratricopeptide (TPR) repeat protein